MYNITMIYRLATLLVNRTGPEAHEDGLIKLKGVLPHS